MTAVKWDSVFSMIFNSKINLAFVDGKFDSIVLTTATGTVSVVRDYYNSTTNPDP